MKADKRKLDIAVARKGFSRRQLATQASMPLASVYNVFQGKEVRPETLGKLAKALDADVTEIIASDEGQ